MSGKKNQRVTDAMTLMSTFAVEYDMDADSVTMLVDYMKDHDLDFTHANLTVAYKTLCEKYFEWEHEQKKMKQSKLTRQEIDSWSSEKMKSELQDDNRAAEIEYILSQPVKKTMPKPEPKPKKYVPPVRTTEEQIIESMTADQMKGALARGRGPAIENILTRQAAKAKKAEAQQ